MSHEIGPVWVRESQSFGLATSERGTAEPDLRLVLVDVGGDNHRLLRDLLPRLGEGRYELDWVADYEAAIETLWRGGYDVYLVCSRLGKHDGLQLIREARQWGCRSPILVLTTPEDGAAELDAMEAGATGCLFTGQLEPAILRRALRAAHAGGRLPEQPPGSGGDAGAVPPDAPVPGPDQAELNRRRLGVVLEASREFVALIDASDRILYLNRTARELLGLPEEAEASELHLYDCQPGWAHERFATETMPAVLARGSWTGDTALLDSLGGESPVTLTVRTHVEPGRAGQFFSLIAHPLPARISVSLPQSGDRLVERPRDQAKKKTKAAERENRL